jgi:hypothetical protein
MIEYGRISLFAFFTIPVILAIIGQNTIANRTWIEAIPRPVQIAKPALFMPAKMVTVKRPCWPARKFGGDRRESVTGC